MVFFSQIFTELSNPNVRQNNKRLIAGHAFYFKEGVVVKVRYLSQ